MAKATRSKYQIINIATLYQSQSSGMLTKTFTFRFLNAALVTNISRDFACFHSVLRLD